MYINEETKKALSRGIGIPYEELLRMDQDELEKLEKRLTERTSNDKNGSYEGIRVEGLRTATKEWADEKIDSMDSKGKIDRKDFIKRLRNPVDGGITIERSKDGVKDYSTTQEKIDIERYNRFLNSRDHEDKVKDIQTPRIQWR